MFETAYDWGYAEGFDSIGMGNPHWRYLLPQWDFRKGYWDGLYDRLTTGR